MKATLNQYQPMYDASNREINLPSSHKGKMTLNQLQQLVRLANVEYSLNKEKSYGYHIYEKLFQFDCKEAVRFLMVGVGDVFFEADKLVVLSLVGRYYLGDYAKRLQEKY